MCSVLLRLEEADLFEPFEPSPREVIGGRCREVCLEGDAASFQIDMIGPKRITQLENRR